MDSHPILFCYKHMWCARVCVRATYWTCTNGNVMSILCLHYCHIHIYTQCDACVCVCRFFLLFRFSHFSTFALLSTHTGSCYLNPELVYIIKIIISANNDERAYKNPILYTKNIHKHNSDRGILARTNANLYYSSHQWWMCACVNVDSFIPFFIYNNSISHTVLLPVLVFYVMLSCLVSYERQLNCSDFFLWTKALWTIWIFW